MAASFLITMVSVSASPATQDYFAAFPHPIWDSGIYPVQEAHYYWVDDDTILFNAYSRPKPQTPAEVQQLQRYLYLWRLGEKPHPYGPDPIVAAFSFCAADGWVRYSRVSRAPQTGRHIVTGYMEGPLGQEREEPLPPNEDLPIAPQGWAGNDFHLIDRGVKCQRPHDPRMAHHFWVTDTYTQYRLDFGTEFGIADQPLAPPQPIVLMRADGSDRVDLPITTAQAAASCTHFHRFDKAFLVWDCFSVGVRSDYLQRWQAKDNCWPVWRVEPGEGRTQKICLPFGTWVGSSIALVPTKAGLFFASHRIAAHDPRDPGAAGLYQLQDGTARRILVGFIWQPAVSPSGCKVVFNYVLNNDAFRLYTPGTPSVVAIDLCKAK